MTMYDLARQLGEAIRDTKETQEALAARAAYDANPEAQALLDRYSKMQQQYNDLLSQGTPDGAAVESLGKEIRDAAHAIQANPVIDRLMKSEDAFNDLVKGVFGIVNAVITGEPESCTGTCSTCGGCH